MNKNDFDEKSNIDSSREWEDEMSRRISERVSKLENKDSELLAVLEETSRQKKAVLHQSESVSEKKEVPKKPIKKETPPQPVKNDTVSKPEPLPPLKPLKKVSAPVIQNIPEPVKEVPEYTVSRPPKKKKKKKKKRKSFKESFLGLFPQHGDSMLEKCRKIIYMISIITIIICGYIVLDYYIDTTTAQNKYEDIMQDYIEPDVSEPVTEPDEDSPIKYLMTPSAQRLYNMNPDVVGVINIPDTDVFYPVVKGKDNVEYLNKTVSGDEARAGSIFIDYRNIFDEVKDGVMQKSSDNIIIYGHEMATGKMFGSLKMYKDNSYYYEEHPIIEFNSNYFCYKYKIFSVMIVDADDKTDTRYEYWNALDFDNEKEFYDFVNEAKRRNIRLNDVDVKYGDPLITLSTCNEIFGKEREGRLVIMARRLRDGEDPLAGTQNSSTNPNIKWPSIYYDYNNVERFKEEDFVPYG